jgi:hypothetical protein
VWTPTAYRLLLTGTTLFALVPSCASRAIREAEAQSATWDQEPAEVRRLLPGFWELVSIDDQEARGWLSFGDENNGSQLAFSLRCGAQNGTYELEGDMVLPQLTTSVVPNCSSERLAASAVRVPEVVFGPFEVNVSATSLLVRGRARFGQSSWALYVRSARRRQSTSPEYEQ